MKVRPIAVALILVAAAWFSQTAVAQTGTTKISGKVYQFEKIADSVYYSTALGSLYLGGNHTVIINDQDVVVVDAGTTPEAARALLQDIKLLTNKPVRWVIDTHFHWDHAAGNSMYGPEVQIIAHEFVRHAISDFDVYHQEPFTTSSQAIPNLFESLKKQIAAEKDPNERAVLEKYLATTRAEMDDLKTMKPVPPTMTFSSKFTLYRGQREIQLLFLGRGHTQGDTVVYLPKERIVCTGDLMQSRLAYMGDGLFDEWITTLEALKAMDFDTVLPGHGVAFHEKSLITAYQDYLKDLMAQVEALRKQGVSADQAAEKVDLTSHAKYFSQITGPGAEIRGVRRMYEWMDARDKK